MTARPVTRAAAALMSGSMLGQLMMLLATVLVARWISPAQYALFGVMFGATFMLASLATLGTELRIPIVDDTTLEALLRVARACATTISTGVLLLGLALAAAGFVVAGSLLCAISIALWLLAAQLVITALLTRAHEYRMIARMRIAQAGTNAVLMVAACMTVLHGWHALACAWIVSIAVGICWAGSTIRVGVGLGVVDRNDLRIARVQLGPTPLALVLSGVSTQMALVALPGIIGPTTAGQWALVSRLYSAGATTATATVQPLYVGRVAQLLRAGDSRAARHWQRSTATRVFVVALAAYIVGGITLEFLVPLLAPSWAAVGSVLPAAILAFTAQTVAAPLSGTMVLLGRVRLDLVWEAVRCTAVLAALAIGSILTSVGALHAWAATVTVLYVAQVLLNDYLLSETTQKSDVQSPEIVANPVTGRAQKTLTK